MSIKSTRRITRQQALEILTDDIQKVGNDVLGNLMDVLADTKQSHHVSYFDNFIVSDFVDEADNG